MNPFIQPVNIIRPITISSTPPALAVQRTQLVCRLKKPSTWLVNMPTAKKGRIKPRVYTPISTKPIPRVAAEPAISSTLVSAGPTQGVQAKLKVNPSSSAVSGFMPHFCRLKGSRHSRCMNFELKKPSCTRPSSIIRMPPMRATMARLPLKKRPRLVKPSPRRKNAKLTPITKNTVLRIVTRRRCRSVRSPAAAPPARYPRYSGTSGSTHGEKKLSSPCTKTVRAETPVSTVKPIKQASFLLGCPCKRGNGFYYMRVCANLLWQSHIRGAKSQKRLLNSPLCKTSGLTFTPAGIRL